MSKQSVHTPVLVNEVVELLQPDKGRYFIDATAGEGGHALAVAAHLKPHARLLAVEKDPKLCQILQERTRIMPKRNITVVCGDYLDIKVIAKKCTCFPADGILFDLGISSWHLEQSGRGFTFQIDEPLDMRFDPTEGEPASKLLERKSLPELVKIFSEYGQERYSKRIARALVEARLHRPIITTFELVSVIRKAIPLHAQRSRIHFATRVFQALRIAVNDELRRLAATVPTAFEILSNGGRLAVISFHSLEDRIVKNSFRDFFRQGYAELLTRKPIKPSIEEKKINPRSRSAKLRAIKKL